MAHEREVKRKCNHLARPTLREIHNYNQPISMKRYPAEQNLDSRDYSKSRCYPHNTESRDLCKSNSYSGHAEQSRKSNGYSSGHNSESREFHNYQGYPTGRNMESRDHCKSNYKSGYALESREFCKSRYVNSARWLKELNSDENNNYQKHQNSQRTGTDLCRSRSATLPRQRVESVRPRRSVSWAENLVNVRTYTKPRQRSENGWQILKRKLSQVMKAIKEDIDF